MKLTKEYLDSIPKMDDEELLNEFIKVNQPHECGEVKKVISEEMAKRLSDGI